jgi:hypothetical protein
MHKVNSKEELEKWDNILDEYENALGFTRYKPDLLSEGELNTYFTMNRDALEKLSPEDCAQISYRLGQFAFHIQRTLNREIARHNWADETVKEIISDEINNYKGYGYVEKFYQAVKHNDRASNINAIKKYAKQRIDRLSYISNTVKNLADMVMNIQKTKVKHAS